MYRTHAVRAGNTLGARCRRLLGLCALGFGVAAGAINNPEAPDYIGEFQARAAQYEQAVAGAAGGNASAELGAWVAFLERELAVAEAALAGSLADEEQHQLQRAQSHWRAQFDADEQLMRSLWSPERAGSSAALSVGQARATALQQRVELLLRMRATVGSHTDD